MMRELFVILLVTGAAGLATLGLRRYALARNIIDAPNARSSHSVPTPRGGGVAIVLVYLLALLLWMTEKGPLFWSLFLGGGVIAAVGFRDDQVGLSARLRFSVHLLAAAFAVLIMGGLPRLDVGFGVLPLGLAGAALAVLGLAWVINLYNFMDGIDGLAGSEAVFLGAAGGGLLCLQGGDPWAWWLLGSASAGFLLLNWPPARIFMGDAGSGFLGFAFGVLIFAGMRSGPIWPWLILPAVFVTDASLTLLRRAARRVRLTDAHRTHAYQWASRQYGAHRPVTLAVLLLNGGVVAPAAWVAWRWPFAGLWAAGLVYGVLGVLAWRFHAGVPERGAS